MRSPLIGSRYTFCAAAALAAAALAADPTSAAAQGVGQPAMGGLIAVGSPGAGLTYTNLQTAIDQSPAGSTLFIGPGTYAGVVVSKPISLIGAGSSSTFLLASGPPPPDLATPAPPGKPALIVRNVPSGTQVRVVGFRLLPPPGPGTALEVRDCAGVVSLVDIAHQAPYQVTNGGPLRGVVDVSNAASVLFESCDLRGVVSSAQGAVAGNGLAGLRVENSHVTLNGCTVFGNGALGLLAGQQLGQSGPGIHARNSRVHMARTTVRGGDGGVALFVAGAGAPGLVLDDSDAFLAGGQGALLRGGRGKSTTTQGGFVALPGGTALSNFGVGRALIASDVPLQAGVGGDGLVGPAVLSFAPSVTKELPFALPHGQFEPSGIPLGGQVTLKVAGAPLSLAWPWLSWNAKPPLSLPGVEGWLVIDTTSALSLDPLYLGFSGTGSASLTLPTSPSLLGLTPSLQLLGLVGFEAYLGPPTLLTIQG